MADSDSDRDSNVLFDLTEHAEEEEKSLLQKEPDKDKISGKAWGRVKNLVTHSSNFPKVVFLVLGTEFCERFTYYGMRTILVIYLTEWLGLAYYSAVSLFHLFSMLAYFSPVLGAVIADGYLGRFRTIFYLSLVYGVGTLLVAVTAFPPPEIYGPVIGLLLIGLGTGGIKPCVTAFGGDQFSSHQEKERLAFFSAFYFVINMGSTLSTFLTPILRADVHCFEDSCYPLAFGVPSLLMFLSIAIFVSGKKHYKHFPPTGNLFGQVARCVWHGVKLRFKQGKRQDKDGHWLDYSRDTFEDSFVDDVKSLLSVLWLFLPLPLFWALFNQQGSRWTLQAVDMNGDIGTLGRIKPDQVQVLNPIFILLLIPLFEKLIYPCLNKLRVPNRPLQRMSAGMVLCSLAFVVAGFVQLGMEDLIEAPLNGKSGVTFINTMNCSLDIQSDFYSKPVPAFQASPLLRIAPGHVEVTVKCKEAGNPTSATGAFTLESNEAYRLVVHTSGHNATHHIDNIFINMYPDSRKKDADGKAALSIINFLPQSTNTTVWLKPYKNHQAQEQGSWNISLHQEQASNFTTLEPGQYQVFVGYPDSSSSSSNNTTIIAAEPVLNLGVGSVQTVVLQSRNPDSSPGQISAVQYVSLKENEVSMAWMIPQYFVITVGEILFSITGLGFAYSQAPVSMKSILQAAWLSCVAVGDLIVIIVAEARFFPSQSAEFFMFACLMGLNTVVFVVMAYRYKSRQPSITLDQTVDTTSLVPNGNKDGDISLNETASGKLD